MKLALAMPSRGFILLLYTAATGIFVIGLQSYVLSHYDLDLFRETFAAIGNGFTAAHRLTGWTLYGFLPLVSVLGFFTWVRITLGPLDAKAKRICELIEVLAYALGILGPITHQVFKSAADSGNGAGFGSLTFGILCWVWSVVICFDLRDRPTAYVHQQHNPPPPDA